MTRIRALIARVVGNRGRAAAAAIAEHRGRAVTAGIAGIIALVILANAASAIVGGPPTMTISAQFPEAPGLFVGNHVDVLGIPVGHVTAIRPGPSYVVVDMQVPASVAIPRDVTALLMAPDVVNDRYVQLSPAYSGGARMVSHAVLPLAQTRIPVTPDEIINILDRLVQALGPNGANRNGALSDLLHNLALSFGSTGPDYRATVVNFSQALGALASNNPSQVTDIFNNLGRLTQAMADNTSSYQSFANDLAAVSGSLAADNSDIGKAFAALQKALGQLAAFLQTNQSTLGSSITNLQTFATKLAAQQQQFAQLYDVAPLALQNLGYTVDRSNTKGCPPGQATCAALRARYDPSGDSKGLVQTICGNQLYRGLIIATNPTQANMIDLDCAVNGSLGSLTLPPGASTGPNLSLGTLLQGSG
jgi:phospholipid/cholesterol/gamma-HCH transport system substrate-binding protein